MKRVLGLTLMIAFFAALAIGYGSAASFACGLDKKGYLSEAGYYKTTSSEKLENVNLEVKGMTCDMCAKKIKSELAKLSEVKSSEIDWKKGTVAVKVTPGSHHEALSDAVKKAGFEVSSIKCECGT